MNVMEGDKSGKRSGHDATVGDAVFDNSVCGKTFQSFVAH